MGNPIEPGTRLGPYEIRSMLGFGGMGEVYRAHDTRLGRDVAVKVLGSDVASDESFRRRFQHEARAVASLNHPNIVAVYDVGDNYIVSEFVEGKTLRASERFTVRQALDIGAQIADGLSAAHAIGIIHRDIKPENIMVTRQGRAKVLDFGLAKPFSAALETGGTVLTQTGMVIGTVGYMSPEQLRGAPLDHRSDIFSFGAVLHEMLGGQKVFSGNSAAEVMSATLMSDPQPLPATLPPGLAGIVMQCLEKDPARRFQSTHDLGLSLRALSTHSHPTQVVAEPAPPPPPPPRQRFGAVVAGVAILAALAAGLGAGRFLFNAASPVFVQQTEERGFASSARFASGRSSIIYSAQWNGEPLGMYLTEVNAPESRSLGLPNAHLFSVSAKDDVAVGLDCEYRGDNSQWATLAVVRLHGGAPRTLLRDVSEADWDPAGGQLAVAHNVVGTSRIEYPIGKVLYQTPGWIADLRFSPAGDRIAFSEHMLADDDRGTIGVVDLKGNKKTLTQEWESVQGTAWSKGGKEIWFGAAERGYANSVYAVSPEGKSRMVTRLPIGLKIHDLSADGALLFSRFDDNRSETFAHLPQAPLDRSLDWFGSTYPADLTADGKVLLFSQYGDSGGVNHSAYMRKLDDPAPMRLGEGDGIALSPDGKRALVLISSPEQKLLLYEYQTPNPVPLPASNLSFLPNAVWFPDSRRVLFAARETGKGVRLWVQEAPAGQPKAVTPEGVFLEGHALSPDSSTAAGKGADGLIHLYPLDGAPPRDLPGAVAGDRLIRWTADGRKLVVRSGGYLPVRLYEIDLTTGKRVLWKEVRPHYAVGVSEVTQVLMSADGETVLYGQNRRIRSLHVAYGLR